MIGALSPWRSARPASTVSQTWQEHLRHTGVPGGAYAVVTSQGTRERTASGVDGNGRPWTERTPTLWGSISKPIAASVADAAISRGELRVTDPITEHLSLADCSAAQRVTVADLVHHTSGVGAALTALDRGSTRDATQVVHDNARDLCPTTDPERIATPARTTSHSPPCWNPRPAGPSRSCCARTSDRPAPPVS